VLVQDSSSQPFVVSQFILGDFENFGAWVEELSELFDGLDTLINLCLKWSLWNCFDFETDWLLGLCLFSFLREHLVNQFSEIFLNICINLRRGLGLRSLFFHVEAILLCELLKVRIDTLFLFLGLHPGKDCL